MRLVITTFATLCALALAGCGSMTPEELPAPAGPAPSPPVAAEPVGRVVASPYRDTAAPTARAGGREFTPDRRASRVEVREDGRRIARLRTALEPVAVAASDQGRKVAVLSGRERRLELFDATTLRRAGAASAGTGPAGLASDGGNYLYVTDAKGGALLVFRIVPELHLLRRYPLPGAPYGIAHDARNNRLWATLTATNELVELSAGARVRELRRFPAVRQPDRVEVDPHTGRVTVTGEKARQVLEPPPLPRNR